MRIAITGTHGIPACYGGFETFAFHLALACAEKGMEVTVVNEMNNPGEYIHRNIKIINSRFNKSSSPLKFYQDSLSLVSKTADIILSCGVGGALYYPTIKSDSLIIITNVDGLEHLRTRYSLPQRMFVYYLQKICIRRSNLLIADSFAIEDYWKKRFRNFADKILMIPYGADFPGNSDLSVLKEMKLEKNKFFLVIARLVPENNIHLIVDAFIQYKGNKKLVIVGSIDKSDYITHLRINNPDTIIFAGSNYNKNVLDTLRKNCFIYLHGHSVGGTNPSLLEAMAAGCVCICSDNIFNREVTNNEQLYFHDSLELTVMMNILDHEDADLITMKSKSIERIRDHYTWELICTKYIELFNSVYERRIEQQL